MIEVVRMEGIPVIDGKCYPFEVDLHNMGTPLGTNILIMHQNFPDQKAKYLIVVNRETGERVRLAFELEGVAPTLMERIVKVVTK